MPPQPISRNERKIEVVSVMDLVQADKEKFHYMFDQETQLEIEQAPLILPPAITSTWILPRWQAQHEIENLHGVPVP